MSEDLSQAHMDQQGEDMETLLNIGALTGIFVFSVIMLITLFVG